MADKFAYAYFNPDGTLREFIIDPSVRQGNIGFNKIRFYWESEEPFTALSLSYINTDDEDAQWSEPRVIVKRAVSFSIPAIQDYDPRYFKYGKTYEGYEFSIPEDILSQTGNVALSLFAINQGTRVAYLGLMTMYISETGASFQSTIDKSQYYYLLEKIQEIAEDDGSGGAFVTIDSDRGTLTDEELELIGNPATVIKYVGTQEDELYYFDFENPSLNICFYKRINIFNGGTQQPSSLYTNIITINKTSGNYTKSRDSIDFYNRVKIDALLAAKQDALTFDSTPTENSTNPVTSGGLYNKFESIEELIPAQASAQNQLADKDFVNSSIATNTAYFLGTYNIVTDLGLTTSATHSEVAAAISTKLASLSITVSNNDYVFIAYPDATVSTQFTKFERYKYNSDDVEWDYEYTLNNSSFTAAQWAAINSGITAEMIGNFATTNTYQTIESLKTFVATPTALALRRPADNDAQTWRFRPYAGSGLDIVYGGDASSVGYKFEQTMFRPLSNANKDLGSSSYVWKDLYLSGIANIGTGQLEGGTNYFVLRFNSNNGLAIGTNDILSYKNLVPNNNNSRDLGKSSSQWRNVYIAGNITDGTNSVTVAHLAQNVPTQWYGTQAEYDALGTYDSNTIYNILES